MVGYGPLYPVAYLPATLAGTPASAVAVATLLAHFYILFPIGLLCVTCARRLQQDRKPSQLHWSVILLFFALMAYAVPSLNYVTTHVHVDAPALGLFLLAGYSVLRACSDSRNNARWLLIAGVCAGLSAACKINLAVAAIGFFLWIIRCLGAKRGFTFLAAAALAFCSIYALAVVRDGLAAVLLNLRLPGKMPWNTFDGAGTLSLTGISYDFTDKLRTLLTIMSNYVGDYGIVTLALLLLLPALEQKSASATQMIKFFLFLALVLLLVSVASLGKSGGDANSRALVSLPLALAAIFAFATILQPASRTGQIVLPATLSVLIFVVALATVGGLLRFSLKGSATLTEAYQTVSTGASRWYFPFDPLAHMLAEKKLRPNMDVIHSYAAAGAPVDKAAFRSALPENLEYLAIPPAFASWGTDEIVRLLPEYGRIVREPRLENHQVISR
jgi:hypothetical protein